MAVTIDDVYKKVVDLYNSVEGLPSKLLIRAGQIVIYSGLSDISEKLGIIRAGEFRAGNRNDPNNGFSGMRMAYPAMRYNNEDWNLVGVENDALQFGVRASDGKLIAGGGAVVLDNTGVNVANGSVILNNSGITAVAGSIAGWQIQPTRLMNNNISLYSTGSLQTNDFASGVLGKGWRISSDGSAEFNNAFIRGELRTSVLTYQEVQAVSGTLAIFKSAGVLLNPATVNTGSFTIDIKDPPSGHVQIFSINDRLRIKTGNYDVWFNVTNVSDQTTFYRYTCSYVSGSSGVTFEAGTAVINYGQSGQGLIEISTIGSSAPFLKLGKHTGNPHTGINEYLRIGNLDGSYGYSVTKYGIGIGEYVSGKTNLTLDEDGAIRIRNFTAEFFVVNSTGLRVGEIGTGKANVFVGTDGSLSIRVNITNILRFTSTESTIENVLKIAGTSSAIAIGNPPPTSSTAGTGLWLDRTGLYGLQSNVRQAYFGSNGKLYAGNGNVTLESSGIIIAHGSAGENSIRWMDSSVEVTKMYSINTGGINRTFVIQVSGQSFLHIENPIGRTHIWGNIALGGNSNTLISSLSGVFVQSNLKVGGGGLGVNGGITIGQGSSSYTPYSSNILAFVNSPNYLALDGFSHGGIYSYNSILYATKFGGTLIYPIEPVRQINLGVQAWVAAPTYGATRGMDNNFEYWAFADGAIRIIDSILPCPIGTIDGNRKFTLSIWFNNTTNSGNVFVFFEIRAINDGTYVPSGSVIASGAAAVSVPTTAGTIKKYSFSDFVLSNGMGAYENQALQIRIYRNGGHANDTNAGEMRLFAAELRIS